MECSSKDPPPKLAYRANLLTHHVLRWEFQMRSLSSWVKQLIIIKWQYSLSNQIYKNCELSHSRNCRRVGRSQWIFCVWRMVWSLIFRANISLTTHSIHGPQQWHKSYECSRWYSSVSQNTFWQEPWGPEGQRKNELCALIFPPSAVLESFELHHLNYEIKLIYYSFLCS